MIQRRELLKAIGYTAAGASSISGLSFAAQVSHPLVVVFLRGGADSLQMAAPVDDPNYVTSRPAELRIQANGPNPGIGLSRPFVSDRDCRVHSECAPLNHLLQSGHAQILHACGLENATRSHFEAQDLIEAHTTGNKTRTTNSTPGWLTPHLKPINSPDTIQTLGTAAGQISSLQGLRSSLSLSGELRNGIAIPYDAMGRSAIEAMYDSLSDDAVTQMGRETLSQLSVIDKKALRVDNKITPYVPAPGITYNSENAEWSNATQTVAQLIKMDVGLQAACIDFGGWDTHEYQSKRINNLIRQWSSNIRALFDDLQASNKHVTILVLSEFGRRLRSNGSAGTDHGHAGALWLFDTQNRGLLPATQWPGLGSDNLDQGLDLQSTTDIKKTVSTIARHTLG